MSKRSEAIQTARALDARGSDFGTIVRELEQRLGIQASAARGIAAQACKDPRGSNVAHAHRQAATG